MKSWQSTLGFGIAVLLMFGFIAWTETVARNERQAIDAKLQHIMTEQRAVSTVRRIASGNTHVPPLQFCSDDVETPLCSAIALKMNRHLGEHSDLWIFMDAVVQVSRAKLDKKQRRWVDRLLLDLGSALGKWHSLDAILENDDFSDMISATDLYYAILAQALVCRELAPSVPCTQGIPAALARTLGDLAAFVLREGPTAASYKMSIRIENVRSLVASGFLPEPNTSYETDPITPVVAAQEQRAEGDTLKQWRSQ